MEGFEPPNAYCALAESAELLSKPAPYQARLHLPNLILLKNFSKFFSIIDFIFFSFTKNFNLLDFGEYKGSLSK